jgi:hypothetical protein
MPPTCGAHIQSAQCRLPVKVTSQIPDVVGVTQSELYTFGASTRLEFPGTSITYMPPGFVRTAVKQMMAHAIEWGLAYAIGGTLA